MENIQGKKLLARSQLRRLRFMLTRSTIERQIDEILPTLIVEFSDLYFTFKVDDGC